MAGKNKTESQKIQHKHKLKNHKICNINTKFYNTNTTLKQNHKICNTNTKFYNTNKKLYNKNFKQNHKVHNTNTKLYNTNIN